MATYTKKRGFDASHYQTGTGSEGIQYGEAKTAGFEFCLEKASEGLSVDPTFADRQPRVRLVFAVRGWYHFVRSIGIDAAEQGRHVRAVVGELQANEYVVFDLEEGCGLSGADGIAYVETMIAASGYAPSAVMIYLSDGWANGAFGEALERLTVYHLWDARYSAAIGSTAPWTEALVWQDDEFATVPGIGSGSVDRDWWLDGHWPVGA